MKYHVDELFSLDFRSRVNVYLHSLNCHILSSFSPEGQDDPAPLQ